MKRILPTTVERSKLMSSIRSKDTKVEVELGKALWYSGIRFRKNSKKIYGCPDFSIKKYKVAIFTDGEFFHGFNWELKKLRIKANRDYWIPKIERNIQRDKEVNEYLTSHGWTVLRFWSQQVKKDLDGVVAVIKSAIEKAKEVPPTSPPSSY